MNIIFCDKLLLCSILSSYMSSITIDLEADLDFQLVNVVSKWNFYFCIYLLRSNIFVQMELCWGLKRKKNEYRFLRTWIITCSSWYFLALFCSHSFSCFCFYYTCVAFRSQWVSLLNSRSFCPPQATLQGLCEDLGIPFQDAMLK